MSNVVNHPRSVRDCQIRINSLNCLPKPLVVDGMNGPNTRKALKTALEFLGGEDTEDLFHDSGITRIHWHWTASTYTVNSYVRKHYNDVFDDQGNHYDGKAPAQQQAFYIPGRVGVSHTYMANTGAIGMAVASMHGASSSGLKVSAGDYPITWEGIDAMLERSVEYCRAFDIKPSIWTTLTHAEVQGNIGIRQRGKWDIQVLPNDLKSLKTPREVGDVLRQRLKDLL